MNRFLIILGFCIFLCTTGNAQITFTGPTLSVYVRDTVTKKSLVNAPITVISGKDKINLTANVRKVGDSACASYSGPLKDSIVVMVTYPGYESYQRVIRIIRVWTVVDVWLTEKKDNCSGESWLWKVSLKNVLPL